MTMALPRRPGFNTSSVTFRDQSGMTSSGSKAGVGVGVGVTLVGDDLRGHVKPSKWHLTLMVDMLF